MSVEQSINRVELVGRVGADPRVGRTEEGRRVINFNVATTEVFRSSVGELREETCWHRVVLWESKDCPDFDQVRKGKRVHVKGRMRTSVYEKDGQSRYSQEILAQQCRLVSDTDLIPN